MKRFLTAAVAVTMIFTVAAGVSAKSNIGLMGVGAKVGYLSIDDIDESAIGFGGVVDLGQLMPRLNLEGEVLYWGKSYDYGWGGDAKFSEIIISALGKYCFPMKGSKMLPYAGGGLGLVLSKFSWDAPAGYSGYVDDSSESETDIGFHLLGGTYYDLSPQMKGFAEFRYTSNGADFWGIFAGFIYNLK
ncbi:MAG: porin family protein [Acidobacteria bacterium]|nr:porin family protein [Acidobacteriota bacterium]